MVDALIHRGPDDEGLENFGACVLGNRRLAIIDLSERGRMPMCNEHATIWITYNGECYNAPELRSWLESRGHKFRSTTDTEVIIHLYEEFGDSCAEKLRGMFAFAIWDDPQQKLLLARDRLGIKPLYLAHTERGILFASEIKSLLASGLMSREVDPAAVRVFLQLGHVPAPWTVIRGVTSLEPGHIATWHNGQFKTRPYWVLPRADRNSTPSRNEVVAKLQDILLDSSRVQLASDVPVALFLSGGVDSAIIGSLMRTAGARDIVGLTIGFAESEFDESDTSLETAKYLEISHRVVVVSSSSIANSLDRVIWSMDQPTVDGLNTFSISRAASEAGFKVTVSGQGGDELFGGYASVDWFQRFTRVAESLQFVPRSFGRYIFDHDSFPFRWRKLSYLVGADDPFVGAQMAVRVLLLDRDVRDLLDPQLAPANGRLEAASFIASVASQTEGQNVLDRIALLDFAAHLVPRLLRDGDAMSMAHSLEIRPTFLDHRLVEFVMSLPASLHLQRKRLLLEATRPLMPSGLYEVLAARPKRTFTFPFARWLGKDLRSTMETAFDPQGCPRILNRAKVYELWRRYLENPASVGWSRIWSLFVLSRWCRIMQVGI